jgi:hypothetical protein
MNTDFAIPALLALMVLIGGPLYLISKAVDRRRAREAEAWRLSTAGFQHHAEIATARVDSLGPLTLEEHQALLFNLLWVSSHQGAVGWDEIVAQTGAARQMVRHHLNSLETETGDHPAPEDAEDEEQATTPEPDAQPRRRH